MRIPASAGNSTLGQRLANTPVDLEKKSSAEIRIVNSNKIILDESLRITKNGYLRSDAAILGIMRSRAKKQQKRRDDLKKARKAIDKKRTLEMNIRRKLKGSCYDVDEQECNELVEDLISFNELNGLSLSDYDTVSDNVQPTQHELVMKANKMNKIAKKNRKMARRLERSLELETLFKFRDQIKDVPLFEMVEVFDEIPIPVQPFSYYDTSLMRVYGFTPNDVSDPFRCSWLRTKPLKVIDWTMYEYYKHTDMLDWYRMEIDPDETLRAEELKHDYSYYNFDDVACESKEYEFAEMVQSIIDGTSGNSYRFECSLLDGYQDPLAHTLHELLTQKGYTAFDNNRLYIKNSFDPEMNEPVSDSFQSKFIEDLYTKLKEHSVLSKYSKDIEGVVNFIIFVYLARRQSCLADRLMVFQLYLSTLNISFKTKVAGHVLYSMAYQISKLLSKENKGKIELESFSETLSDFSLYLKQIVSSNLVTAIRDFFVTVAAMNFLQTKQVAYIHKYLGKAEGKDMMSLFSTLIDATATVLRAVENMLAGVPLSSLLFSRDPTLEAVGMARRLYAQRDCLYSGLPVQGMMCQKQFVVACEKVIPFLKKVIDNTDFSKLIYKQCFEAYLSLNPVYLSVKNRILGSIRAPPFCIVLYGEPGVGKAALMDWLCRIHSEVKGRVFDSNHVFHRIVSSDYWEGYDPWSHPYVHYSELGAKKKQLVQTQGDDTVQELTSVIDSVAMPLNMAFGDKGKMFFNSELVIIDTNNKDLNLDVLFNNPAAFRRRFLYINPKVIDEFKVDGGSGLDFKKSEGRRLNDKHIFDVYREIQQSNTVSHPRYLLRDAKADDVFDALVEYFRDGIQREDKLLTLKKEDVFVRYGTVQTDFKYDENGKMIYSEVLDSPLPAENMSVTFKNGVINMCKSIDGKISGARKFAIMKALELKPKFTDVLQGIKEMLPVEQEKLELETFSPLDVHFDFKNWFFLQLQMVNYRLRLGTQKTKNNYNVISELFASGFSYASVSCVSYLGHNSLDNFIDTIAWFIQFLFGAFFFMFTGPFSLILSVLLVKFILLPTCKAVVKTYFTDRTNTARDRFELATHNVKMFYKGEADKIMTHLTLYKRWYLFASLGATLLFFLKGWFTSVVDLEHTSFEKENDDTKVINKFEELTAAGASIKRIKKGTDPVQWTIKTLKYPVKHTHSSSELVKVALANVRRVQVEYDEDNKTRNNVTHVIGICKDYAIINTHALPKDKDCVIKICMAHIDKAGSYKDTWLTRKNRYDLGDDISVVRLSQVQFKDLTNHFSVVDFNRTNGFVGTIDTPIVRLRVPLRIARKDADEVVISDPIQYSWSGHSKGYCGYPVLGDVGNGAVILGIHCAGAQGSSHAYGTILNKDRLVSAMKKIEENSILMPLVSQSDDLVSLADPVPKSPFMFEDMDNVEYLGYDGKGIMPFNKSKIQKSILCEDLPRIFEEEFKFIPETKFVPPLMHPKTTASGEYVSPYNVNLRKIGVQKKALNRDILETCIQSFLDRAVAQLHANGRTEIKPLDVHHAINGDANDAYLRRINASTGAGYGFKGKKNNWIPVVHEDEKNVTRLPSDELLNKVAEKLKSYAKGQSAGTIFGAKLKDEPRAIEKVLKGKTRMFYPAAIDYLIVSRMYLAPLFTLLVEFNETFCTSVGINMMSEGDAFYRKFEAFSDADDCIFDGDYGGFDTSMPFEIGLAAASFIYRLAEAMGYNEEALQMLAGVLVDSLFPIIEVNGDIFICPGLMTSGGYGTAEFNCIRSVMLLMYYFAMTPGLSLQDFWEKFLKTTYGDDVTGVVKKSISHLFNNVLYAEFCEKHYGMEFTTPTKTKSSIPLRRLDQMEFLKRKFRKHPDLGDYRAILDMNSIYRMLYWRMPSDNVTPVDQMISTCNSALWELFLHLDKSSWLAFRTRLAASVSAKMPSVSESDFVKYNRILDTLCPNATHLREEGDAQDQLSTINVIGNGMANDGFGVDWF